MGSPYYYVFDWFDLFLLVIDDSVLHYERVNVHSVTHYRQGFSFPLQKHFVWKTEIYLSSPTVKVQNTEQVI